MLELQDRTKIVGLPDEEPKYTTTGLSGRAWDKFRSMGPGPLTSRSLVLSYRRRTLFWIPMEIWRLFRTPEDCREILSPQLGPIYPDSLPKNGQRGLLRFLFQAESLRSRPTTPLLEHIRLPRL